MTNFVIYNTSDILLSMLFNLLLANTTILLCFFYLFLVAFKNFFTNPAVIENARLQPALIIRAGAPITVANDAIGILPVATDKIIHDLSKHSKEAIYLLRFLLISSFLLISAIK